MGLFSRWNFFSCLPLPPHSLEPCMTDPATLPSQMTSSPLPLPADRAVYLGISTDHYPWTEVTVDLTARQAQEFTGVFDAMQDDRWARFVWVRGNLLGGFTRGGQDVPWAATTHALPRAWISLAEVTPAVANIIWSSRAALGRHYPGNWPDIRPTLERELFYGLLISGTACSMWDNGQVVGGQLPPPSGKCLAFSPHNESTREDQVKFWQDLVQAMHRSMPLDDLWRQVIVRLSDDFPCLDPFAQEIAFQGGKLEIDPNLSVAEFRPALYAAVKSVLARAGLKASDLKLGELRDRPEWATAGLESK